MNRNEFISELREKLYGLSSSDIDERVEFYSEMIHDRMEDGLTEEEAIAEIGSVDSIVEQIMTEIPLSALVKEKIRPKRKLKVWEILLLVLGSPLWIPLVIAIIAVLLTIYIVIWTVVVTFYIVNVALVACAVGGLIGIFISIMNRYPVGAFFTFGFAIACAGLAILMYVFNVWFTKFMIQTTKKIFLAIKKSFIGKGE